MLSKAGVRYWTFDLIRARGSQQLVAMSDSALNNSHFQYPCLYGRLYSIALSYAPLAQGVIRDDIPPRDVWFQPLPATLCSFFLLLNMSFFPLCSIQKRKAISAGWSTANHDGGLSNC
jgi:hypothetical protein